jgi:hypothetical protein
MLFLRAVAVELQPRAKHETQLAFKERSKFTICMIYPYRDGAPLPRCPQTENLFEHGNKNTDKKTIVKQGAEESRNFGSFRSLCEYGQNS